MDATGNKATIFSIYMRNKEESDGNLKDLSIDDLIIEHSTV